MSVIKASDLSYEELLACEWEPGDVIEYDGGAFGPGKERYCAAVNLGGRQFCNRYHKMEVALREALPEAGTFDAMDYRAAAVIVGRFAAWAESNIPEKCGICPVCVEEKGGCPHGWSARYVCPDCRREDRREA